MNTTNAQNINDLITTALKDAIEKAVQAHLDDKLEALDADVAGALVYFNRRNRELETANEQLSARVTQLEKRADMHAEKRKDMEKRVSNLEEAGAFLIENLRTTSAITLACQDEIKELRKATAELDEELHKINVVNARNDREREQEIEDIIADAVDTRVNEAIKHVDLTEQVRYVLADARICI